ncbi:MAG: M3 family oligoendopeptidase, partial [Alphaproteobacteria bacterium]
GDMLTETQVLHLMNTSTDPDIRRDAALAFSGGLESQKDTFALIMNNLVKDKATEDRWRHFSTPASSRHLQNQVEGEVVETLVQAVRDAYPTLSHRYYEHKARWLNQSTLNFWDRNAPLPKVPQPTYTWDQAKDIVLSAYQAFSPEMATIGRRFFDQGWIHAAPDAGKDSGAYAHPCVPEVHPYILMNFKGSQRDVMTLAHELGHGIHQVLSAQQGYLMSDTPLTLAETASVFGEMLTFQSLLKAAETPEQKRALTAAKIEDMLNTVVRQIAFHTFETKVHAARAEGELSTEDLAALWMQVQTESLGPAITLSDPYKIYWTYIQHFIHSPFYVYAYAFGDCLVNALYATYQKQPEGFAETYITFLKKGGTQPYDIMLSAFGLNPKDPTFWQQGLSVIEGLIQSLTDTPTDKGA